MMNEHPEEQRRRVETDAILRNELNRLGLEAMSKGIISNCGYVNSEEKPYIIQFNGEKEYYTQEEAKSKLKEILGN